MTTRDYRYVKLKLNGDNFSNVIIFLIIKDSNRNNLEKYSWCIVKPV